MQDDRKSALTVGLSKDGCELAKNGFKIQVCSWFNYHKLYSNIGCTGIGPYRWTILLQEHCPTYKLSLVVLVGVCLNVTL